MLYSYEFNKAGIKILCGVKTTKLIDAFNVFSYVLEWFSVGFLFYLNGQYIHSKLFALFVFIVGLKLMYSLDIKRKLTTKEEFISKMNEVLESENQCPHKPTLN